MYDCCSPGTMITTTSIVAERDRDRGRRAHMDHPGPVLLPVLLPSRFRDAHLHVARQVPRAVRASTRFPRPVEAQGARLRPLTASPTAIKFSSKKLCVLAKTVP
jgi:hypothetical protein